MKHRQLFLFFIAAVVTCWFLSTERSSVARESNVLTPAKQTTTNTGKKSRASLNASVSTIEMNAADTVLASHNIILFIDQSGSMAKPDCPDGLSRWDWCAEQSGDLARRLAKFTQDNLTIIPFATTYSVHRNCTASTVEQIFKSQSPTGNTNLLDPLVIQLAHYIANPGPTRRPLVIAIITDGKPAKEQEIEDAIINTTKHMQHINEVSIVFLQIGNAFNGKHFLTEMDQHLVERGAKFDIVSVRTFDSLIRLGLAQNLANAIVEIEQQGKQ